MNVLKLLDRKKEIFLEDIIENENKNIPHTDDQLTKLLNKKD